MHPAIAVVGIHTDIGKTVVSAVITEALAADYWKPVQAGSPEDTDSMTVRRLVSNKASEIHPEAYRLTMPLSPHAAAKIDGVSIELDNIPLPAADKFLVVETAGGVHSPMNDQATMVDFVAHYHLPCVLVVQHYLGSINHSIMSIEVIQKRGITIKGIIINGLPNAESEEFISRYTQIPILAYVPQMVNVTPQRILEIAKECEPALQLLKR